MSRTHKVKIVFALSASLGVIILHGFSFFAMAVCLYAGGVALIKGTKAATFSAVVFGGLSLLFFNVSEGPALLAIGAVLAVVLSDSAPSRYLFFLSAAAILIDGAIEGMIPLTAAVLVASPVKRDKLRAVILAGGFFAVMIISGLPSIEQHRSLVSQQLLIDEKVLWPETVELNLSMPELILEAPGIDAEWITLKVSAGGVRDSNPVGYVTSAGRTFPVYPGENALIIEEPDFPVSIRISRFWKPFTHPVIHFNSAEASI
jgi:hypothetical protein